MLAPGIWWAVVAVCEIATEAANWVNDGQWQQKGRAEDSLLQSGCQMWMPIRVIYVQEREPSDANDDREREQSAAIAAARAMSPWRSKEHQCRKCRASRRRRWEETAVAGGVRERERADPVEAQAAE